MGQLDQIDHLCVGLKEETRQEVSCLRCQTLRAAVSHAQPYERAHFTGNIVSRDQAGRTAATTTPEPMDISALDSRQHAVSDVSAANLCVSTSEAAPGSTPLLFCDAVVEGHKLRMLVDLGVSHCIGKPGNVVPFPVEQKVNITARGFDGKSESRVVCTGKLVVSVERCQSTQAPFLGS
ncbi:hypothetical protein PInf_004285 [Phytophthora infestans]|nr:hypothetical protein PInf_004285 [Phytophthora infestans]